LASPGGDFADVVRLRVEALLDADAGRDQALV
jgi:hypothetical protein